MNEKDTIIATLKAQNYHLLWLLMEYVIHRYLLSNTHGRLNGTEKAEAHLKLSAIFIAYKYRCSIDRAESHEYLMTVHDATQELTGQLDKEIGFPIKDASCDIDYDMFAGRFFSRFVQLAEKACESKMQSGES